MVWRSTRSIDGRRRSVFRRGEYQPDGRVDPFGYASDLGAGRRRLRRHLSRVFACGRRFLRRPMRLACRPTSPMRVPPNSTMISLAVAAGSTLAPVVGGYLLSVWSGGRKTFDTPARVAKFALVVLATTMISATAGVVGLSLAGYLEWTTSLPRGRLVVARCGRRARGCAGHRALGARRFPTFQAQQGAGDRHRACRRRDRRPHCLQPADRADPVQDALAFLAVLPLLWAALRCGPRNTATTALIFRGSPPGACWRAKVPSRRPLSTNRSCSSSCSRSAFRFLVPP